MKDVLELFGDLPDFPGKRAPKNRPVGREVVSLVDDPYANVPFKTMVVKGEKLNFYNNNNIWK
jgi:hypothetical protein